MDVKSYIKKNKIYSIIFLSFLVWITTLIFLAIIAKREVYFYDYLAEKDVSSHYSSTIPFVRYLIEPLIGYILVMGINYDVFFGFFLLFIIIRFSYYGLKRKGFFQSEKAKLLWFPVKDFIRFAFIVLTITISIGGAIIIIMLFGFGFLYVNLYWMVMVQIIIYIDIILIGIKGVYLLYIYLHSHLKFNYLEKNRYKSSPKRGKTGIKLSRIFRRETTYFFGLTLLFLGTNLVLISTYFPVQEIRADLEKDEYLFDFHVHTILSDGWLTPEERVQWYIDHGIHGAAFSDHDNRRGAIAAREYVKTYNLDFIVIIAEEWTDHENGIHLNIFGLDETIVPEESEEKDGPKAMDAEHTIKYVKKKGGYVIVNHYNYNENPEGGYGTPYSLKDLREWGIDGFEIINNGNLYHEKIREFCINNSLAAFSNTDTHSNEEMESFNKLKVKDPNDLDAIFTSLKKNEHETVAINTNPKDVVIPEPLNRIMHELELDFIEDFIEYFLNCNSFQLISWMVWSAIGFTLLSFLYKKSKKIEIGQLRNKIL
ncbi:MAG: PHP domain-containing protein [Promethearchaeota archaeon]